MPLVEVVPHPGTSSTSIKTAIAFYKSLGKSPVLIHQETPGFVANRLQVALNNEAYSLVQRGIVSAEDCGIPSLPFSPRSLNQPAHLAISIGTDMYVSDTCVTTGVGLRWAFTGPFMTNVLGGGGGKGGFRHLLEHLGPAAQGWTKDMRDHPFVEDENGLKKLDSSVQEMLAANEPTKIENQRDEALIDVIKRKRDTILR